MRVLCTAQNMQYLAFINKTFEIRFINFQIYSLHNVLMFLSLLLPKKDGSMFCVAYET